MSEAWSQWQGQVIDGKFHLKQYLGGSGQSAVFLARLSSDARGAEAKPVAIRLIADSPNPELQLSRWRMALDVSHPHLLRILDSGRCRLGVIDLIYAVMEYGEENLGQIVTERPLTAEEAREMLEPALDALIYLHSRGLVHAHLKPASIMAIGDQLKLASDGICPADVPVFIGVKDEHSVHDARQPGVPDTAKSGAFTAHSHAIYNAPETAGGVWSAAADVWSLGATLAEVLTQHPPSTDSLNYEADPLLPENLPVQFVEIVRGCLRRDLQLRWTIPVIRARLHTLTVRVAQAPTSLNDVAGAARAEALERGSTDNVRVDLPRIGAQSPSPAEVRIPVDVRIKDAAGGGCAPNAVFDRTTNDAYTDRNKYQGTSSLGPSRAPIDSGALAPALTVTFAEALRTKDLASQAAVQEKPLARAAAATAIASEETHVLTKTQGSQALSPDVLTANIRIKDAAGGGCAPAATFADNASHNPDNYQGISSLEGARASNDAGALASALALAGRAFLATITSHTVSATRRLASQTSTAIQRLTSQTAPTARRIASQTKTAVQRVASQAKRIDLVIASQIETLIRRSPAQTVQRLGLAIVIIFTTSVALYISPGLLRHKPASQSAGATTKPAPRVVIAHPERKPSPKKRSSAAPAKPQPGTPLSTQPASQSQAEQSPAPPALQSKVQPASIQPQPQPVSMRGETPSGARHIDDGGAQDDADDANAGADNAPPPSAPRTAARTASSTRNDANSNAAPVSTNVDGVQPVLPEVSRSALHTIRGTVRVSVRVKVDPSGNVARAELASAGPSRYFARKSLEAAQNWKFAPGQNAGSPLLLHFEFRNSGARAFATRVGG
jgi:TonB family protein